MTTEAGKNSGKLANKRVRPKKETGKISEPKKRPLPLSLREMLDSNPATTGYDPIVSLAILAQDQGVPQPARIDIHKYLGPFFHSAKAATDGDGKAAGSFTIVMPGELQNRDLS